MWLLTIEDYEGLTTYHRLSRERYRLGRSPDNDFVLAQLNISRHHARLERAGGGWLYCDEGSLLGSYVNCGLVFAHEPVSLDEGSVVQFGDYILRFSRTLPEGSLTPTPRYVAPARVRALSGPLAGAEHVFGRDQLVSIGRSDDCTLRIVHPDVSMLHAVVRPLPGGRHELVDRSDDGRLFINGRKLVADQVLEGGDSVDVAGVVIFRYLEASQQSDPSFDECWGDPLKASLSRLRVRPLVADESPTSAPGRGLALVTPTSSRAPSSSLRAAPAPAEESAGPSGPAVKGVPMLLDERVEALGPVPLPSPRPASASYQRLRLTTIGVGPDSQGRPRGVVLGRELEGSANEAEAPRRRGASAWPLANAPDVDPAREGRLGRAEDTLSAEPPEQPAEHWYRRYRAFRAAEATLVVAAAFGAMLGLRRALPAHEMKPEFTSLKAAPPRASIGGKAEKTNPSAPQGGAEALAGGAGAPARSIVVEEEASLTVKAPVVVVSAPRAPRAAATPGGADEPATRGDGGRRAKLEARAKSGRASEGELRELLSLCQGVSDMRCIGEVNSLLQRAQRGP
jgi:pSer/pThr/pTyr-binding forkhead associated (FHA) protein